MQFDLDSAIQVLERTPDTVRALLSGLDQKWVTANEGEGTFSAFDIVGHLIDGEETDWIVRARIILSRDANARFEPYDRFRHYERNRGRTLTSLLDEFTMLRGENIDVLRSLNVSPDDLALTATHPALGTVTLAQLLATWVVHDLGHIAQISRVMAKQYRDEVGPWARYLPVLTDRENPAS